MAALAAVVVGLALFLQGEPARDVVQLSSVGQVDQDLQGDGGWVVGKKEVSKA